MSIKCNYCQNYDKEYPNPKCINCRSGFNDDMNKPDYFEIAQKRIEEAEKERSYSLFEGV